MPMDLNRNDWIAFARVWMAGMTFLGAGLLLAPAFLPPESAWISKGTGTALLLVAASILFVVVFEALGKAGMGMTGPVASVLTAVFGYAGTIKVLASENPLLLAFILVYAFYTGWIGAVFVWIAWLRRSIFNRRP